jgi:hypothetical protein
MADERTKHGMRFRLRTLLIVLSIAPPVLACTWWASVYAATYLDSGSLSPSDLVLGVVPLGIALVIIGGFLGEAIANRMTN